jgi:ATP/maltotriose-dependent transcriptional regulator MalT
LERSLALRPEWDRQGIAGTLGNLAGVALHKHEIDRAVTLYEEELRIKRELGDGLRIALTLGNLGGALEIQGDLDRAETMHQEALQLAGEQGNQHEVSLSLASLGDIAKRRGQWERAAELNAASLRLTWVLGDRHFLARRLQSAGTIDRWRGDFARAAVLLAAGDAAYREVGSREATYTEEETAEAVAATRAALGDSRFEELWSIGRRMPIERAKDVALGEAELPHR